MPGNRRNMKNKDTKEGHISGYARKDRNQGGLWLYLHQTTLRAQSASPSNFFHTKFELDRCSTCRLWCFHYVAWCISGSQKGYCSQERCAEVQLGVAARLGSHRVWEQVVEIQRIVNIVSWLLGGNLNAITCWKHSQTKRENGLENIGQLGSSSNFSASSRSAVSSTCVCWETQAAPKSCNELKNHFWENNL